MSKYTNDKVLYLSIGTTCNLTELCVQRLKDCNSYFEFPLAKKYLEMSVYTSPLINISLPEPIVLPTIQLTGLYGCMLGIDYVLLRYQDRLPITPRTLKAGMTVLHAAVPLAVVSPYLPNNVAFAAVPWFLASNAAYSSRPFSLSTWSRSLYQTMIDPEPQDRRQGLIKAVRGLTKLGLCLFLVEPALPASPDQMLALPWLSLESVGYSFLFGLKAYLLLGGVDLLSGLAQLISGWRMIDIFDSPFLATGSRDFWSRRWNLLVRNVLHKQVFELKEEKEKEKPKGFFKSRTGRGLMTFIVSGLFHELVIGSVCRKLTLENFCFFTLHGLVAAVETHRTRPKGWRRVAQNVAFIGFLTLTGRLFLAPYIRTRFTEVLPLTYIKH